MEIWSVICDALQQNREQVTQVYFEIRQLKLALGWKMTNLSILRFFFFFFFNAPQYDFYHLHVIFWQIFKHFPTKNSTFSAACQIQSYRNNKLWRPISQITLPEKLLKVLYTNSHISKSRMSMNLILVQSWKYSLYNDAKNLFYSKCYLLPVLWECIAYVSAWKQQDKKWKQCMLESLTGSSCSGLWLLWLDLYLTFCILKYN